MPREKKLDHHGNLPANMEWENVREISSKLVLSNSTKTISILKLFLLLSVWSQVPVTGLPKDRNVPHKLELAGVTLMLVLNHHKEILGKLSLLKLLKSWTHLTPMSLGLSSMANTVKAPNPQLSPTWSVMYAQFTRELRRSQHVEDDFDINLFLTDYVWITEYVWII